MIENVVSIWHGVFLRGQPPPIPFPNGKRQKMVGEGFEPSYALLLTTL